MKELLLAVDFFCPVLFFFLGRAIGKKEGRALMKDSLLVFLSSLMFSPIVYIFFSVAVQGVCTALLIFLQFAVVSFRLYKEKILL